MARPSFRLRRILRLKTQLRKVAQDEIARVRQDLAVVEKGIADTETARTENLAAATEAASQGRAARDLQLYEVYDRGQREFGQALRLEAYALVEVAEAQRGILLKRRREERQFECLDERQRQRDEAMEARIVANLQDDLARRRKPTLHATQKKKPAS